MKYNRVLLKLSGESLMGKQSYGIDPSMLEQYAKDIKEAVNHNVEVAIVIGGGNIFRGLSGAAKGMDRVQGDYMGMLATLINSMALQAELEKQGLSTELLSGLAIEPICNEMLRTSRGVPSSCRYPPFRRWRTPPPTGAMQDSWPSHWRGSFPRSSCCLMLSLRR